MKPDNIQFSSNTFLKHSSMMSNDQINSARNAMVNNSLIISPRKNNCTPFVSNIMNRSFSNIRLQQQVVLPKLSLRKKQQQIQEAASISFDNHKQMRHDIISPTKSIKRSSNMNDSRCSRGRGRQRAQVSKLPKVTTIRKQPKHNDMRLIRSGKNTSGEESCYGHTSLIL